MKKFKMIIMLSVLVLVTLAIGITYAQYNKSSAADLVPQGVFKVTLTGLDKTTPATYGTITVTTSAGQSKSCNFVYGQSIYLIGGFDPFFSGTVCSSANLYNALCPAIGTCKTVNGIGWNPPTIGPSVSLVCTED